MANEMDLEQDMSLTRLKQVVETYGATPQRWPAAERASLEVLARACQDAPWMCEARETDLMLSAVPGMSMRSGLASDILAAARQTERAIPGRVIDLDEARREERAPGLIVRSGQAVLLAASLAAGFWVGATDQIETMINGEPLGLAAMVPGVEDDSTLDAIVWRTFYGDESLP